MATSTFVTRFCCFCGGVLALVLAVLGVFLPLLPTTPFVILAAFLFAQLGEKWVVWLYRIPGIGVALEDWEKHRAIRKQTKYLALVMIGMSAVSIICFTSLSLLLKGIVTCVLGMVMGYLYVFPERVSFT